MPIWIDYMQVALDKRAVGGAPARRKAWPARTTTGFTPSTPGLSEFKHIDVDALPPLAPEPVAPNEPAAEPAE